MGFPDFKSDNLLQYNTLARWLDGTKRLMDLLLHSPTFCHLCSMSPQPTRCLSNDCAMRSSYTEA